MDEHVVIGMDPHKRSATIEVSPATNRSWAGRFDTDYWPASRRCCGTPSSGPSRTWAVEGCQGIGGHIARRLVMAGETVVDVPPKLSARTRMFATRQGRKTDAADAHSIALVGLRMTGLRPVVNDDQHALLRILVDRRRPWRGPYPDDLPAPPTALDLIPGGAKRDLSAAQARRSLPISSAPRPGRQDPQPDRLRIRCRSGKIYQR